MRGGQGWVGGEFIISDYLLLFHFFLLLYFVPQQHFQAQIRSGPHCVKDYQSKSVPWKVGSEYKGQEGKEK